MNDILNATREKLETIEAAGLEVDGRLIEIIETLSDALNQDST